MAIPLDCACGRRVNAPEKFAGKSVRCTYCGASLPVPSAVPAPATVSVACACGKALRAPASMAGKSAKCPACGASVAIPAAGEASYELAPEVPRSEPPPEPAPAAAPSRRAAFGSDRPLIRTEVPALPGPGIVFSVLGILDSLMVILVAGVLVLASTLAAVVSGEAEKQGKAAETADAQADAVLERIKRQGGSVSLNADERGRDGSRVRQIEYVAAGGERKTELVPLGDLPESSVSRKDLEQVKDLHRTGLLVGLIGVVLGLVAVSKIVCAGGTFLRRDWGRAGMVLLGAVQSILLVAAVAVGGMNPLMLGSLMANAGIVVYFLSGRMRAACSL